MACHRNYYTGEYEFGAQNGDIYGIVEECGEIRYLLFSFQGLDEGDEINGIGIASVKDGIMTGKLLYHLGDMYRFKCK